MIGGFRKEEHVDDRIFKFLYSLNQSDSRPGASDSCLEEVQVSGGYVLVEGEVNVVGTGFKDVIAQLGSVIGVVKMVVDFLRVEEVVV